MKLAKCAPSSRRFLLLAAALILAMAAAGCSPLYRSPDTGPVTATSGKDDRGDFLGAGATFPSVLYQGWFVDYHELAPGVRVNYQSIGSGAGISQFNEGVLDFGATDAPMSDKEMAAAPQAQHLPTVIGAVALGYNLPGVKPIVRLDPAVAAGIFLGAIKRWDDPAIAALNPGVRFPAIDISVVHRSDSSGTTYVFTDWLNKTDPGWKRALGRSKAPNWPVGLGGLGNEGVATLIEQTPGAIGYIELNYVRSLGLPAAAIRNGSGEFVTPSIESAMAAAADVEIPDDYRVSLTGAEGSNAYPISSFTYLLIDRQPEKCTKARVLFHLLWWMYHAPEATELARELDYAPLPAPLVSRIEQTLLGVTCEGAPLLTAP